MNAMENPSVKERADNRIALRYWQRVLQERILLIGKRDPHVWELKELKAIRTRIAYLENNS